MEQKPSPLPPESQRPELSIVIPFFNEEENVGEVLRELREYQPDAEIIAVDDGSTDGTWALIGEHPDVHGIRLTRNCGQSAALYVGLTRSSGHNCAMMDGDGQNDPRDIRKLLQVLQSGEADVVCGQRVKRRDTWSRRAASRIANGIRRSVLNDGVRDTGCSLKVFPREALDCLVPFNGLHRFLPAIFKHAGLKLVEVPVNHRERTKGTSKYNNWDRALRGVHDLIGVRWLLRRKVLTPPVEEKFGQPMTNA